MISNAPDDVFSRPLKFHELATSDATIHWKDLPVSSTHVGLVVLFIVTILDLSVSPTVILTEPLVTSPLYLIKFIVPLDVILVFDTVNPLVAAVNVTAPFIVLLAPLRVVLPAKADIPVTLNASGIVVNPVTDSIFSLQEDVT